MICFYCNTKKGGEGFKRPDHLKQCFQTNFWFAETLARLNNNFVGTSSCILIIKNVKFRLLYNFSNWRHTGWEPLVQNIDPSLHSSILFDFSSAVDFKTTKSENEVIIFLIVHI